ncbi:MAG: VWA domain-containing protein, partial [Phycisphaerae bacterium]|nr:VWA domain-containing protein [Phycisphaerae bacterium]
MRKTMTTTCMLAIVAATTLVRGAEPTTQTETKPPLIQMAILLDTSGSMSGLIEQAKSQLWSIVNEFALATRDGKTPRIEVALYEYGKSTIPAAEGHIRMILPLTTDLDKVSEELFALTTNGGDEYCGQVIQSAVRSLAWSKATNDLKVIFIAGNEPFTQGQVDYRKACRQAIARGIVVNTIHCGTETEGEHGKWKDGAALADGRFINIDHNQAVVQIDAPQDVEIARLNEQLNDTYIPYGPAGEQGKGRQITQDRNAAAYGQANVAQRVAAKASKQYDNAAWDLVDAVRESAVDLEKIVTTDLPEAMQNMTAEQRQQYVREKTE